MVFDYGFNYRGAAYRVAYFIDTGKRAIYLVELGSHEGFWEEIKRYYNSLITSQDL